MKSSLSILFLIFSCLPAFSQVYVKYDEGVTDPEVLLARKQKILERLATIPREYLTLEYDKKKGMYPGDTVHFRVSSDSTQAVSNVVYVDLVHPSGSVVQRRKLRLDSTYQAKGEITLDTLFQSGFYELRAYTRFMTNWLHYDYPSHIIPVFTPPHLLKKKPSPNAPYISTSYFTLGKKIHLSESAAIYDYRQRMSYDYWPNDFVLVQPTEKHLMVFGKIVPKVRNKAVAANDLENKSFNVVINQGKKMYNGKVTTDNNGYFAILFPDSLRGEYNMFMYEKRTSTKGVFTSEQMAPFRVLNLEDFAPAPRRFQQSELEAWRFGYKKWHEDKLQGSYMNQFINIDELIVTDINRGKVARGFYTSLGDYDKNFSRTRGVASPQKSSNCPDTVTNKFIDLEFPNGNDANDPLTVCLDGPSYKGRPIVWILDGMYRLVTGMGKPITDFQVFRPSRTRMPSYIDEVSTVFITEDPKAFASYMRCSEVEKRKPVTVFINTHKNYMWNDSGLMSTHFFGYDN